MNYRHHGSEALSEIGLGCRRPDGEQPEREMRAIHAELRSEFLEAGQAVRSHDRGNCAGAGSEG